MIRELIMPQLAMGMSEGTILEWIVAEGDYVERDTSLLSIETEKVVTELPAPGKGYLHIMVDAGTAVPVENIIGKLASTEEEYQQLLASWGSNEVEVSAKTKVVEGTVAVSEALPSSEVRQVGGRVKASGLAKKIASLEGAELSTIVGTGPGGRIVKRDVLQAVKTQSTAAPVVVTTAADMVEKARIPLTGMRGAIAKSVAQATTEAAPTSAFFEVDVTKLLAVRKTMLDREEQLGVRVSMAALILRALALACQDVPIANATIAKDAVTVWENVNVAIAVALPGKDEYDSGIAMPVLKNVEAKTVLQITREMKELTLRARNGELAAADMSDHTIMMSSTAGLKNPGAWGISAPVLKLPAIMAFQPGSTLKKPVVIDGQIVVRDILPCGLTFDHRATDGVPVGKLMAKISDLLSNPELMLL